MPKDQPKDAPHKQIAAYDPKTNTFRMLTRKDGSAIDKPEKK